MTKLGASNGGEGIPLLFANGAGARRGEAYAGYAFAVTSPWPCLSPPAIKATSLVTKVAALSCNRPGLVERFRPSDGSDLDVAPRPPSLDRLALRSNQEE